MQINPPHGDGLGADEFSRDPSGLPEVGRPQLLELADGDTLELRVGPVAMRLGDTVVWMLGYNGSVPGPTLKVAQGSELVVSFSRSEISYAAMGRFGNVFLTAGEPELRLAGRVGEVVRWW